MGLEILLGVISSAILEIIKVISKFIGKEQSKAIVLGFLFVIVLAITFLINEQIISKEMLESYVQVLSSAIATYQLIIKPIVKKLEV
jgi:hypothetical protein